MSRRRLDPNIAHAQLHSMRDLLADLDSAVPINSHVVGAELGRAPRTYRDSFSLAVECGRRFRHP